MVVGLAGAAFVGCPGSIRQHPEIVVEGVVLLHHDDDVIDLAQVAVRTSIGRPEAAQRQSSKLPALTIRDLEELPTAGMNAMGLELVRGGDDDE
jgi:hypothetical protein